MHDVGVKSQGGTRSRRLAAAALTVLALACASCASEDVVLTGPEQSGDASADGAASSTDGPHKASSTTGGPAPAASTTQLVTTTAVPDCVGLAAVTSGQHTFDHQGVERRYELALPTDYDGLRAAPMVVNFHGHGFSAEQHDSNTSMSKLGTRRGFVVVSPDSNSEPASWNVRADPDRDDDFEFIHSLVAELLTKLCVDPDRVYATGHSNGSVFAAYLVCSEPYEFAGVAMVAGTALWLCPPDVQPSVMAIAGTADNTNPYDGDEDTGGSVVEVVGSWATHNGCALDPASSEPVAGVDELRYSGCANDGSVVLMTINGGGHPWPGTPIARAVDVNSTAGRDFDATSAILDFFDSLTDAE